MPCELWERGAGCDEVECPLSREFDPADRPIRPRSIRVATGSRANLSSHRALMKGKGMRILPLVLASLLAVSETALAQPPRHKPTVDAFLAGQKVAVLRDFSSVGVIYRVNSQSEVIGSKEWMDLVQVEVAREVPKLKVNKSPSSASVWMEVSLITAELGSSVTLTLYRWANIPAETHRVVFAPVWRNTQAISGHPSRVILKEAVDSLLAEFGADYRRANGLSGSDLPKK